MIDNIFSFCTKEMTTSQRLRALAEKAEKEPEKYKYLLAITASEGLADSDWMIAGHPSFLMLLGMLETARCDIPKLFKGW